MSGSKLSKKCNLGQNVVFSPGVVYSGVELEDDVFCGPSMVFTNIINPRSHISRKHEYRRTLVKKGASIGANATIVCGVTLGKYSFIAAGAVVTKDVPDYALMAGVPARRLDWMCQCGIRLQNEGPVFRCSECSRQYTVTQDACCEINSHNTASGQETLLAHAAD